MNRIVLALLSLLLSITAAAAEHTASTATTAANAPTATAAPSATVDHEFDSRDTKAQLHDILERMPPETAKVLKLDPTLWSNQAFMNNYPALASFVTSHPEIAHSPAFYLDYVGTQELPIETSSMHLWRELVENATILVVVITLVIALTWLIRTFVEQRRWTSLSRVQTEVHNKLLDRFTSNDELLAYIQTPAGKRFLESAPIPVSSPRALAAPIDRILWSVQIGLVMVAGGVGLKLVSWSITDKDAIEPLSALGVIAVAIGLGFVVSAGASYVLSRKFGLWSPPAATAETID